MFNIVVKNSPYDILNMGLEASSKKDAIKLIILQYQDWYQLNINESDIIDIYQVKPSKYQGKTI
jgi:hypothetical protein